VRVKRSHAFPVLLLSTSHFALRSSTTTMLFSRNLFAAFVAVAAAGVSGSPVEPEKRTYNTKFKFCEGKEWQGDCTVPDLIETNMCHDLYMWKRSTLSDLLPTSNVPSTNESKRLFSFLVVSRGFFTRSRCGRAIGLPTAIARVLCRA